MNSSSDVQRLTVVGSLQVAFGAHAAHDVGVSVNIPGAHAWHVEAPLMLENVPGWHASQNIRSGGLLLVPGVHSDIDGSHATTITPSAPEPESFWYAGLAYSVLRAEEVAHDSRRALGPDAPPEPVLAVGSIIGIKTLLRGMYSEDPPRSLPP